MRSLLGTSHLGTVPFLHHTKITSTALQAVPTVLTVVLHSVKWNAELAK